MVKVFIDAIDECHKSDRDDVIRFLHSLKIPKLMPSHNFALFMTSRYHPDGQISFGQRIDLEKRTQNDIRTYIETMLRLPTASGTRRMVTEELQKCADGSFLWLSLLLPRINILSGQGSTQKEMLREIQQCPRKLDQLYEGLLDQIGSDDLPEAGRLFQWICHSKRRLKVSELRTALAIHATSVEQSLSDYLDEKNPDYIPDDETMIKRVRYLSQGLVNKVGATDGEDYLGFHHTSITQFMLATGFGIVARKLSDLGKIYDKDNSCFANACIRFLSTRDIQKALQSGEKDLLSSFPFFRYASAFWLDHAVDAEKMKDEATVEWPTSEMLQAWITGQKWIGQDSSFPWRKGTELVHIAARHGLVGLAQRLLDQKRDSARAASHPKNSSLHIVETPVQTSGEGRSQLQLAGKKAFAKERRRVRAATRGSHYGRLVEDEFDVIFDEKDG